MALLEELDDATRYIRTPDEHSDLHVRAAFRLRDLEADRETQAARVRELEALLGRAVPFIDSLTGAVPLAEAIRSALRLLSRAALESSPFVVVPHDNDLTVCACVECKARRCGF